jgi:putative transposase
MCRMLEVSRSGFHAWLRRAPPDRQLSDGWLLERIRQIHKENRKVYGAPRIHAELRMDHGICVGRKRVERLMREAGLSGLIPTRRGRTTIRVPGVRVADDLVERQFCPETPNVLWVADITYLRTWEGWLYLAAVQDGSAAGSWGGRWPITCAPIWSWTRCRWRSHADGRRPASRCAAHG